MEETMSRRIIVACLGLAVLAAAVACAAPAPQPAKPAPALKVNTHPTAAQAAAKALGALTSGVQITGSHVDIDVYLDFAELAQLLGRTGAIPKAVADEAVAESKNATSKSKPGEDNSYVQVRAHLRLSEIIPLFQSMNNRPDSAAPKSDQALPEKPAEQSGKASAETPAQQPEPAPADSGQ
jgi:hypothetical protein